ncbi:unnamed protein product [Prunus armeniaca]
MAMVAIAACPRAPFLLLFSIKAGPFSFTTKAMTKGNGEAYVLHYNSGLAWCGRVVPSGVVWDALAFLFFLIGLHHGFPVVAPRLRLPLRLLHGLPCDSGHKANSSSLFLFVLLVLFFLFNCKPDIGLHVPVVKIHQECALLHGVCPKSIAKLFDSLNQGDHVWHANVLKVSGQWEGEVGNVPLVPIIYCNENEICNRLDLESDMAEVHWDLNIPLSFSFQFISLSRALSLSLSPELSLSSLFTRTEKPTPPSLPATAALETGPKSFVSTSWSRPNSFRRRKTRKQPAVSTGSNRTFPVVAPPPPPSISGTPTQHTQQAGPSKGQAVWDYLRGPSRIPRKFGAGLVMQNVRDTPLKYLTDKLRNFNLPCTEVCSRTSLPTERQRDIDIHPQISSRLHWSRDEDRTGRTNLPPNHCDPTVELRAVKHESDSMSLTLLEARMAVAKKARKSFARAKGFSELRIAGPKVDKSNSA